MNFTVIISEQDRQTKMDSAMKTLAEQNITTLIDAAKTLSIQRGSGVDSIKIPQTKEELELVKASLVAEAELLYSIKNRQEDIRFEENSLTVLYSDERETIFDIGSHIVDTGKSLSEALIFASTNPQYDYRLFIELHVQHT